MIKDSKKCEKISQKAFMSQSTKEIKLIVIQNIDQFYQNKS